jgi:hypothetical protein
VRILAVSNLNDGRVRGEFDLGSIESFRRSAGAGAPVPSPFGGHQAPELQGAQEAEGAGRIHARGPRHSVEGCGRAGNQLQEPPFVLGEAGAGGPGNGLRPSLE